jgi:MscS family membrane protein
MANGVPLLPRNTPSWRGWLTGALLCTLLSIPLHAQLPLPSEAPPPSEPQTSPAPKDEFGRDTPRSAVFGFLAAVKRGNLALATQFLNTKQRGAAAERLAKELSDVLDQRLPPKLQDLSDSPAGSLTGTNANQDIVGTISGANGDVDIVVERVTKGSPPPVWLFSRETLDRIPELDREISAIAIEKALPEFLTKNRLANIALFEWLGLFLGIPAVYLFLVLINRVLGRIAGAWRRRARGKNTLPDPVILPVPFRLFLISLVIRWVVSTFALPLLARQFWVTLASCLTIVAAGWFCILLNGRAERYLRRHLVRTGNIGATAVLRLVRRAVDGLVVIICLLVALYHFGLNPTAALAGLGVGGIAVALAAQKTLENMIGGISVIVDKVARVGDTLKIGDMVGTVEDIGLRSTRIRTVDRTLLSVPNGQIANLSLENLSARDKFWFHPLLRLRYDTTARQMEAVIKSVQDVLAEDVRIEPQSACVRFLQFGASSLDVDIFAYILARDWNHFLQIQSELLLKFMDCVEAAGTRVAIPSSLLVTRPTLSDSEHFLGRPEVEAHQ